MSAPEHPVERFLDAVQRRLNRHHLWTTIIWTIAAAAGVLVLFGIAFVSRGYAIPRVTIFATLMLSATVGLLWYVLRQFTYEASARVADRLFHLHDTISSYLHFSRAGRNDGFYRLQAEQTRERVEPLDP